MPGFNFSQRLKAGREKTRSAHEQNTLGSQVAQAGYGVQDFLGDAPMAALGAYMITSFLPALLGGGGAAATTAAPLQAGGVGTATAGAGLGQASSLLGGGAGTAGKLGLGQIGGQLAAKTATSPNLLGQIGGAIGGIGQGAASALAPSASNITPALMAAYSSLGQKAKSPGAAFGAGVKSGLKPTIGAYERASEAKVADKLKLKPQGLKKGVIDYGLEKEKLLNKKETLVEKGIKSSKKPSMNPGIDRQWVQTGKYPDGSYRWESKSIHGDTLNTL